MMDTLALGPIVLLLIVAVICIVAVFKSKSAAIIGGFFAIVIGLFLTIATVRLLSPRQASQTRPPIGSTQYSSDLVDQIARAEERQVARRIGDIPTRPSVRLPAATTESNWNKIDTAMFQAEVFPGIKSAATSLAHRIGPIVTANSDGKNLTVQLTLKKSISDECRFAFQEALQEQLPKKSLITEIAETQDEPKEKNETEEPGDTQPLIVRLTLEVVDPSTRSPSWNTNKKLESGTLACTVSIEGQTTKQNSVVFDEKPWVDRWDEFISKHPANRWAVCTSSDLRSSPTSASESAMQNLLEIELDVGSVNGQQIWVQANQSLIVDRFAQKLTRPYGDVWREALLVDLQGPKAKALIATAHRNHVRMAQQQRSAQHQTWGQGLLLVAVFAAVAIIGMVLNLVTEGYFRGRIVGSIAIGAVIVFGTVLVVMAS